MSEQARNRLLRSAIASYKSGQFAVTAAACQALLPLVPARNLLVMAAVASQDREVIRQAADALRLSYALTQARGLLEAVLRDHPEDGDTWLRLGNLCQPLGDLVSAEAAYRRAIQTGADGPIARMNLGMCLASLDRSDEAIVHTQAAVAQAPDALAARWTDARILPTVHADTASIDRWLSRYRGRMEGVAAQAATASPRVARATLELARDGFLAHYPCRPGDTDLQRPLADTLAALTRTAWPDLARPPRPLPPTERVHVALVSAFWRNHTITRLFGGWLRELDRTRFHVSGWQLGSGDAETQRLATESDDFSILPQDDVAGAARRIRQSQPHVVIFPELGMDVPTLRLAAIRLAPTQAMSWGHPVTSGLPTVDAFLTSAAMEGDDIEGDYAEQPVTLPGLGIALTAPIPPPGHRDRAAFDLRADDIVYLVSQSSFKLVPEGDAVVTAIACRVPRARFVFLGGERVQGGDALRKRLSQAFARSGMHATTRCVFLDPLSHGDFLDLNAVSDIFLDLGPWSGGWSTLEALSTGLVPVTRPRSLMRTRHTAGILAEVGVEDTVVHSAEAFVEVAVRLGEDTEWRASLARRIRESLDGLWTDRRGLRALEAWIDAEARAPRRRSAPQR
jgi:protein O-GlcNAc transferase